MNLYKEKLYLGKNSTVNETIADVQPIENRKPLTKTLKCAD